MSDAPGQGSRTDRQTMWLIAIALCCLVLVAWLKLPGLLLSVPIILVTILVSRNRPDAPETRALRSSIDLSAEDIHHVILDFEQFSNSPDTDSVADRTLYRPALLDQDCEHPDLENFRFQYSSNRRFLSRLPARLLADLTVTELEQLLNVTDRRAQELKDSWLLARRTAKRLGNDY